MPSLDGTGPQGKGSGTGRRMGPCFGTGPCGFGWGGSMGRGFGRGFGFGRGMGCWNCPMCSWFGPRDKMGQEELLKDQKKAYEDAIEEIDKALSDLSKDEKGE